MRLFIAIELAQEVKEALSVARKGLSSFCGPGFKASPEEGLHLTLRFVGACNDEALDRLHTGLRPIADRQKPFEIEISGYGCFPPHGWPRVAWCGVSENSGQLEKIWSCCEELCKEIGFPAERMTFTPHVTLGRIKAQIEQRVFEDTLRKLPPLAISQTITELSIFESLPTEQGPTYTPLLALPLLGQ